MTWQCLRAHVFVSPIAYLKLGSAFALPFAHVFGGRRRRRRGLASTGRAVSLAAALVSTPLILPAGGDAGGARRMWDRGDVGRMKVSGSARSLILVWRVDSVRLVAPRARPSGGRLDRFRWVVLTTATATGLEPHAPAESRREQLCFSGAIEQHSDDTPTADERADSNRAGSSGRSSRAGSGGAKRRGNWAGGCQARARERARRPGQI